MKNVTILAILLAWALQSMAIEVNNAAGNLAFEGGFQMDYAVLNREESADLYLEEGDQLEIRFAHSAGSIDASVGQEGKEPLYRGTDQKNGEFSLPISEAGTYHISVTGHQAKGSVSFIRVPAGE